MSGYRLNFNRSSLLALSFLAVMSLPGCAAKGEPGAGGANAKLAQDAGKVVAVVDGKEVTQGELLKDGNAEVQIFDVQYQTKRHELVAATLRKALYERLLEAEVKATGKTQEQIASELKPAPVTDADVDAFYTQNQARMQGASKEQVAAQIRGFLEQQNAQAAQKTYLDGLMKKHNAELRIDPFRLDVPADGPAKGPASAPVTIVEYSDFQCPWCRELSTTLDQVKAKYGDQVRIVFRQFPLNNHENAQKAAEAALCAHEQGKFWELHDTMFKNQQALGVADLKTKAAELGLNASTFNQCLDSGKTAKAVEAEMKGGAALGVGTTPSFFVNGRPLVGGLPLEQITAVIDEELRKKG